MLMIRPERPSDIPEIRISISAAFKPAPYSDGVEADIVDMLRHTDAMILSLVAENAGKVLGHIAFSQVHIGGAPSAWLGIAPLAVVPGHQGKGIGSALIKAGIAQARQQNAQGCVVMGSVRYYRRFGFYRHPGLHLTGAPTKNFLALPFTDDIPSGEVTFHQAFYSTHA